MDNAPIVYETFEKPGFTLLEILISLFIITILSVGLISGAVAAAELVNRFGVETEVGEIRNAILLKTEEDRHPPESLDNRGGLFRNIGVRPRANWVLIGPNTYRAVELHSGAAVYRYNPANGSFNAVSGAELAEK